MKPFLVGFFSCLTVGLAILYVINKRIIRPYYTNTR